MKIWKQIINSYTKYGFLVRLVIVQYICFLKYSAKYYVKFLNLAPESLQFSPFVVPPKFHKTFDKALGLLKTFSGTTRKCENKNLS